MKKTTKSDVTRLYDDYAPELDLNDPKSRRRKRILDSATALFIENGYRKTSLDDVARHAHVAKGTVYANFKSKAALLVSAAAYEKKKYVFQMTPIVDPARPGSTRLREYIELTLRLSIESPLIHRMMQTGDEFRSVIGEVLGEMSEDATLKAAEFLSTILDAGFGEHGLHARELQELAFAMHTMLASIASSINDPYHFGFSRDTYVRFAVDVLHSGLTAYGNQLQKHAKRAQQSATQNVQRGTPKSAARHNTTPAKSGPRRKGQS